MSFRPSVLRWIISCFWIFLICPGLPARASLRKTIAWDVIAFVTRFDMIRLV